MLKTISLNIVHINIIFLQSSWMSEQTLLWKTGENDYNDLEEGTDRSSRSWNDFTPSQEIEVDSSREAE